MGRTEPSWNSWTSVLSRFTDSAGPGIDVVWLADRGYAVSRNTPYAGGFTTRHYGRPAAGIHVLQIEINRALYMDEDRIEKRADFPGFKSDMDRLIAGIAGFVAGRVCSGSDSR